jgi:hypothetical protein
VEPSGDSVIAGRGAPGATIELLRDGQVHARGVADQSGLFALVPPPLPPGSHQISLQAIAPDGTRQRSQQSVTVAIAPGGGTPPLVALTAPDKPTVVLSNPEPPEQRTAQPTPPARQPGAPAGGQQQASLPQTPPAARPGVRIATVEAEEGGRLFVSGEAAPGATVRLYLNDTLIAPGGVGSDGRVSFAIGRGVRPGDYRVRIDDVDPVSGAVRSRAEVAFNVPAPLSVPLPPQASAATSPPQIAALPPPSSGPVAAPAQSSARAAGAQPGPPSAPAERSRRVRRRPRSAAALSSPASPGSVFSGSLIRSSLRAVFADAAVRTGEPRDRRRGAGPQSRPTPPVRRPRRRRADRRRAVLRPPRRARPARRRAPSRPAPS